MPIVGLNFSDQEIFDGLNLVLPAWILLVVAPRWRVTHWIVDMTTFAFCLLYTGLFATLLLQSETSFDFKEFFTYQVGHLPIAAIQIVLRFETKIEQDKHALSLTMQLQGVQKSLGTKEVVLPAWVSLLHILE